jgi:hypothetical protein
MSRQSVRYTRECRYVAERFDAVVIDVRAHFDIEHAKAVARGLFPDLSESDIQRKVFEWFVALLRIELKISKQSLDEYRSQQSVITDEYDSHDFPGWLTELTAQQREALAAVTECRERFYETVLKSEDSCQDLETLVRQFKKELRHRQDVASRAQTAIIEAHLAKTRAADVRDNALNALQNENQMLQLYIDYSEELLSSAKEQK